MIRWVAGFAYLAMLALDVASAAESSEPDAAGVQAASPLASAARPDDPFIDRAHSSLHTFLWRSAMRVDGWFGSEMSEDVYANATRGSMTPVILWDEFNGFDQKFRFRVKMPLPHLDERYNAFIGTFSRDEFVTEREQASGAIPRQRTGGAVDDDQTLVGIQFRGRRERVGGRFDADAGIRIRSPIDPFVKAGYRYRGAMSERVLFTLHETGFWQNSEGFGLTSRVDIERGFDADALLRWTASATISEASEGVRGYTALTMYRELSTDSAIAGQLFTSGEFDAAVPLGEYGIRVAYRKRIFRDWLVLELRPSLTWPRDRPEERRETSWGFGIGFEMFFGEDEFLSRPATF